MNLKEQRNVLIELDSICNDLEVMGLEDIVNRLRACLPLIQVKRQTVPKIKEPLTDKFKVLITEGKNESEVFFKSDKELEAFCKMKRKSQEAKILAFQKKNNIYPPVYRGGGFDSQQRYSAETEKYTAVMKEHGQHLELSIIAL